MLNSASMRLTASSAIGEHRRRVPAAPRIGRDVELEELSSRVRPTHSGSDWPRRATGVVELVIAVIGIGLQDAGEAVKMPGRMLLPAIARGDAQGRERKPALKLMARQTPAVHLPAASFGSTCNRQQKAGLALANRFKPFLSDLVAQARIRSRLYLGRPLRRDFFTNC